MAKTPTRPWDAAEHLESDEDMVAYLEAALESGDALITGGPFKGLPVHRGPHGSGSCLR